MAMKMCPTAGGGIFKSVLNKIIQSNTQNLTLEPLTMGHIPESFCYQSPKPSISVTTEPTSKSDIMDYDMIVHICIMCT
jgi:hypothetical protein